MENGTMDIAVAMSVITMKRYRAFEMCLRDVKKAGSASMLRNVPEKQERSPTEPYMMLTAVTVGSVVLFDILGGPGEIVIWLVLAGFCRV